MFLLRRAIWQLWGVRKKLSDIGEDALIAKLTAPLPCSAVVGPGDDCAVLDTGKRGWYQLLKTDTIVEHVHFLPDAPGAKVGWKAVARVISDFAAMGGEPSSLLVSLALRPDVEVSYLTRLYSGMIKCANQWGAEIVGGETSSVPADGANVITISGTGWVRKTHLTLRSGAKPGDAIFVTGKLGGSIRGKHLNFTPRVEEAAWLATHAKPSAMMDLSDGLAKDLPRMAAASGCGFRIDTSLLPCSRGCTLEQALSDGEDYELLIAIPPSKLHRLRKLWLNSKIQTPLTQIGEFTEGGNNHLEGGWEHFVH